jgi:hypothetical protein
MQCSGQVFECRALSAVAGKSQSPKVTFFRPAPQTPVLPWPLWSPKSAPVYGSPIPLVMGGFRKPSSRHSRCTRFLLIFIPSLRNSLVIRR